MNNSLTSGDTTLADTSDEMAVDVSSGGGNGLFSAGSRFEVGPRSRYDSYQSHQQQQQQQQHQQSSGNNKIIIQKLNVKVLFQVQVFNNIYIL